MVWAELINLVAEGAITLGELQAGDLVIAVAIVATVVIVYSKITEKKK